MINRRTGRCGIMADSRAAEPRSYEEIPGSSAHEVFAARRNALIVLRVERPHYVYIESKDRSLPRGGPGQLPTRAGAELPRRHNLFAASSSARVRQEHPHNTA